MSAFVRSLRPGWNGYRTPVGSVVRLSLYSMERIVASLTLFLEVYEAAAAHDAVEH